MATNDAFRVGVTLALAAGLSLPFFLRPLRPWPDQGWMLQAAIRHAAGLGLTSQLGTASEDISVPKYVRLVYFPPLYPLAVSGLLKLGITVENAVKGINAIALVIGVFGWLSLAKTHLTSATIRWVYSGLLVLAGSTVGSAMIPKGGTADYLFWAAMPYWLTVITAYRNASRTSAIVYLIGSSILIGLLIGVRWAAAAMVPAGCFIVLWPNPHFRFIARIGHCIAYGLPATFAYLAIQYWNRVESGGTAGTMLTSATPGWRWHLLSASSYPWQSMLEIPIGADALFNRVWRLIDPSMSSTTASFVLVFMLPALLLLAIVTAVMRSGSRRYLRDHLDVLIVIAGTFVVTLSFLAFMTVRYNWDHVQWTYLDEPRYFRPLWPAVALFWLVLLGALNVRSSLRRAVLGLIVVSLIYLLQAHIRTTIRKLRGPDESLELVMKVRSLDTSVPGLHIICDNDVSDYLLSSSHRIVASCLPDPSSSNLRVSQTNATLWFVQRNAETTPYSVDPDADRKRVTALVQRFGATHAWSSSQGGYELWCARVTKVIEPNKSAYN